MTAAIRRRREARTAILVVTNCPLTNQFFPSLLLRTDRRSGTHFLNVH